MAGTLPLAASTAPHPRRPLGSGSARGGSVGAPHGPRSPGPLWHWYENDLGWATVPASPGEPLQLVTGVRFDVLDVPAEAGIEALRHLTPGSPVALQGGRMRLLVAAGGAEELPGLLEWLEWGALALDVRALGARGRMDAPARPGHAEDLAKPVRGAAVWLRPPGAGCEVEASLPTLSAAGRVGGAPDLVRVVETVATECHRIRLRRAGREPGRQALASS
ncbi:SCO3374 family protein [Streptomyces sp. NPDC013172]|uniref:SCO3374 family protein n=1 Tax=Streptomyces sp. NPDC013172 TaxID=3155009 RepID=UPI00340E6F08